MLWARGHRHNYHYTKKLGLARLYTIEIFTGPKTFPGWTYSFLTLKLLTTGILDRLVFPII